MGPSERSRDRRARREVARRRAARAAAARRAARPDGRSSRRDRGVARGNLVAGGAMWTVAVVLGVYLFLEKLGAVDLVSRGEDILIGLPAIILALLGAIKLGS